MSARLPLHCSLRSHSHMPPLLFGLEGLTDSPLLCSSLWQLLLPRTLHHFGSDGKYVHFPHCSRETILDVSFNSPSFNTHIIPLCFLRVLISGFSQNFCCCCCCSYFSKNHLSFFNRQEGEEVCQSAFLRCDKIAEVNNSKERTFILAHSCRGPWAEHRYGQHTVGQKLIPLWQP